MTELQGKIKIEMKCECLDKDGNLNWAEIIDLIPDNDKEA